MDAILIAFQFVCGQWVRWRTPQGARYQIRQRRYVEDNAGVERYEYLMTTPHAVGFDFWASEALLTPDEGEPPL